MRIEVDLDPQNIAFEKWTLKIGFQLEGTHRERLFWGAKYQTVAIYPRLSTDYPLQWVSFICSFVI